MRSSPAPQNAAGTRLHFILCYCSETSAGLEDTFPLSCAPKPPSQLAITKMTSKNMATKYPIPNLKKKKNNLGKTKMVSPPGCNAPCACACKDAALSKRAWGATGKKKIIKSELKPIEKPCCPYTDQPPFSRQRTSHCDPRHTDVWSKMGNNKLQLQSPAETLKWHHTTHALPA